MMTTSVKDILATYNASAPLAEASTIPAPWYVDSRIAKLEAMAVFYNGQPRREALCFRAFALCSVCLLRSSRFLLPSNQG